MPTHQHPSSVEGLGDTGVERTALRDRVYDRILHMLLSEDAAPGARLGIDTIARQLKVSPTPVREALVQLERTGLVTREPLKGYKVAPPLTADQLDELMEARIMLETTATRLATPASDQLISELEQALREHREAGEKLLDIAAQGGDVLPATTAYFARDSEFHRAIFRHCGNRYLEEISETLASQVHRMRQTTLHGAIDVRDALAEHAAVLDAFESDDPSGPERAIRHHLDEVRKRSMLLEAEGSLKTS